MNLSRTDKGTSWNWVAVAIFLLLVHSVPMHAQVAGGTIAGVVTDPSGAVVENATVEIRDQATGISRTVTTNAAGAYTVPNLLPGEYSVVISAKGFAAAKANGIPVTVGAQQQVNVALTLASASESVQVEASDSGVNLSTSTISGEVSGERIRELPLNGRDWTQLATLEPGVNTIRNQAAIGSNGSSDATKATRGFGTQLSVSGMRSNQNNYRLDGISFNDYTNDAPGGVLGTLSGVDSIQEFSVVTTNYSAEYGRTSGGVVNAITRSGSNGFHGDVYEFLRNSAFDSRGYFDGPDVPPFKRNQFGAALGGPIVRDKTFFFLSYEGVRQGLTTTHNSFVPSRNAREGRFANGDVRAVDPAVAPYLAFYPLPNGPETGDLGLYSVATLQSATQNFVTGRLDHKFSDHDSITGTFLLDRTHLSEPDQLNNEHFQQRNSRPFVSLEETHIFTAALVNSVRFGFSRNNAATATSDPINALVADTSLGSVPGRPAPQISIGGGVSPFFGGLGAFPSFTFGWNSFQFYDDAFLTHDKHTFKFGFALERMQSNNQFLISQNGGFTFNSIEDFITNNPRRFSTYVGTPSPRNIRETLLGGYLQDDWRWRPNLTFNLGVRYEVTTVPSEVNGKLSTLTSMTGSELRTGNPYFSNPTLRNFEPRVGFAWDPFRTGRTSVRGGFGLYDVLPLPYEFLIISSNADAPYSANITVAPGQRAFPNAYPQALALYQVTGLATQRVAYVEPNPARSYVGEWNVNLQHEFARNVVATVAYVGSRGIHLPYRTDDANIVMPTRTDSGYVWPTNGNVLNSNVGRIDRLSTDGDSYYHALQSGLKLSLRAVQLQASYTWGKSIDTGSSTIGGDQYTNSPSSLPVWFDASTRRGVSDFNLAHNLVVNGIWSLPRTRALPAAANWAVNGWQIGGILQVSSGAPFSVLMGGDPLGMGGTDPYDYPDRVTSANCRSLVNSGNVSHYIKTECFSAPSSLNRLGNAGRNTLTGPGLVNTDLVLYKNNLIPRLSEKLNVQFRAEIFNLFNRANFAPPLSSNVLFNQDGSAVGSAGQLTALQTPARQVQFGLKLLF